MIGPKPLEDFTDEECATVEAAATEGQNRVVLVGDTLAVISPVPLSSGPFTHVMFCDPLD